LDPLRRVTFMADVSGRRPQMPRPVCSARPVERGEGVGAPPTAITLARESPWRWRDSNRAVSFFGSAGQSDISDFSSGFWNEDVSAVIRWHAPARCLPGNRVRSVPWGQIVPRAASSIDVITKQFSEDLSAIDSHLQGSADLMHPCVSKSPDSFDKDCDRDAFDRIQIHRRAPWDGILARIEHHLARQAPDRRCARSYEGTAQSRDCCVS
jgi:hypothetical protein